MRADSFISTVSGLGDANYDKRETAFFVSNLLSVELLEDAYANHDLCGRICDALPESMFREGFALKFPDTKKADSLSDQLLSQFEALDGSRTCEAAIALSRATGGAVVLMGINDGSSNPSLPVNEDNIRSVDYLRVLSRGSLRVNTIYTDPSKPKYQLPETYEILSGQAAGSGIVGANGESPDESGLIVHESRLIRVDGFPVSTRIRIRRDGWGGSVLERSWKAVRDFEMAYASVGVLMQEIGLALFQVDGLSGINFNGDAILARAKVNNITKSSARMMLMGTNEKFSRVDHNFGGIPPVLEQLWYRLCASIRVPASVFAGMAPAGLNATGDADLTLWYDGVRAEQRRLGNATIVPILRYLMLADGSPTGGVEPESWETRWNDVWRPTEHERAQTMQLVANADAIWVREQILTPEEIANSHFTKDGFQVDIQLDEKTRKAVAAAYAAKLDPVEQGLQPHEVAPTIQATEKISVGSAIDPNAAEGSQPKGPPPAPSLNDPATKPGA